MSTEAFERISAEKPELASLVRLVRGRLEHLGPGAVLRLQSTAQHLGVEAGPLRQVLERLAEAGVLESRLLLLCPHCERLIEDVEPEIAYRVLGPPPPPAVELLPAPEPAPSCPLEGRTPLLEEMAALAQGTPLRGVRLLALVHFLQDLPAFVRALETLGLDITRATFYYRTPDYPQREAITDWLLGRGARVISMTLLEKDLRSLSDQPDPAPLLVLDDRGEIYKTILQKTPLVAPRVRGVIEQTARGAWAVEEALDDAPPGAEAPVICAVDSAWRKKVEAPLVGRAVYESLARLMPGQDPRLLRVGILGYGALGRTLARLFDEAGADVGVYDPDYRRRVESEEQGFLTHGRTFHAVQGCHLVIAASGRCDLGEQDILNMKADAYLASATAEHSELALGDLENLARRRLPHTVDGRLCGTEYILHKGDRRLILLANGYPVNYWGMEGLPPGLSDLAYTLLLVALVKTLGSRLPPGINSGVIDQLAERYHLAELYARHHPLERRPNAP